MAEVNLTQDALTADLSSGRWSWRARLTLVIRSGFVYRYEMMTFFTPLAA